MIITFGTAMVLLLSACAVVLGFVAIRPAIRIFRGWRKAHEEERYELEKQFYLTLTVVYLILGIRLFVIPLYFWTMQSLVPMIPGAMCLWGVFNALPALSWPALALKFLFPVLYVGWLILARINNACKRNPLMRNLMGFYIVIAPLLIADSVVDLAIFLKLTPVAVNCCTSAIDVGPRPIPALIMGIGGQTFILGVFTVLSATFAATAFLSLRYQKFEWGSRVISVVLIPILIISMTEALAPWILQTPLHHCPFCLLYHSPGTILFVALFWYALAVPWWVLLTKKASRSDQEVEAVEKSVRETLWTTSGSAAIIGLVIIVTYLAMALV